MQIAQKNFYKKLLGKVGEKVSADFLKKEGYKIERINYKTHVGEIDIIAIDKDKTIVFVEVKTRSSDRFGEPGEAVDLKKQEKIGLVAKEYLQKTKKTDCPCRFDVIEIKNGEINHIIDAFCM